MLWQIFMCIGPIIDVLLLLFFFIASFAVSGVLYICSCVIMQLLTNMYMYIIYFYPTEAILQRVLLGYI